MIASLRAQNHASRSALEEQILSAIKPAISPDSSIVLIEIAIRQAQLSKNKEAFTLGVSILGSRYIMKAQPIEVIKLTEKYLASSLRSKKDEATVLLNAAQAYSLLGDYLHSIQLIDSAISINPDDANTMVKLFFQSGFLFINLPEFMQPKGYQKALEYFTRAEELLQDNKNTTNYVIILNNQADMLTRIGNYDDAIQKIEECIVLCKANNLLVELQAAYFTRAEIYYHIGEFSKALTDVENSRNIKANVENKSLSYGREIFKAKVHFAMNAPKKALKIVDTRFEESLILSGFTPLYMDLYKLKSEIFSNLSDYKPSLQYYMKYRELKDSVLNSSIIMTMHYWEFKNKMAEREKALLDQEILIHKQDSQINRKNRWLLVMMFASVVFMILIIGLILIQKQKKRHSITQQKAALLQSISRAEQLERGRIAKELHDGVGGMLTIAGINLQEMQRGGVFSPNRAESLHELVVNISRDIRKTIHNLTPVALEHNDLVGALELYCQEINQGGNLIIDVEAKGDFCVLDRLYCIGLYRIVQELVHNIVRHSEATHALIAMEINNGGLNILIEDNGIGFDTDEVTGGYGLSNIKERVATLGGELKLESEQGTGTSVDIRFNVIV
jgi:signal transduction histidine kinase